MGVLGMKTVLWVLCCLEVGLCFGMIDVFVGIRKRLNKRKIAAIAVCIVLMGSLLAINRQLLYFSGYMWILTMVVTGIFAVSIIRKNLLLVVEVIVFYFALIALLDFLFLYIVESICRMSFWEGIYFFAISWIGNAVFAISRLLGLLLLKIIRKWKLQDICVSVWIKMFAPICVALCVMVHVFHYLLVEIATNDVYYQGWMASLVIACCLILLFGVVIFFQKSMVWKKEKEILQIRDVMQEKRYCELLYQGEENNRLLHDMKNHILTLQGLCKLNDLVKIADYLEDLNGILDEYKDKKWCSNTTLNTILNQKIKEMIKYDIQYDIQCTPNMIIPFSDGEIVIMMGNLLDNAIEATQKLMPLDRKITIFMEQKQQMVHFEIINSMCEKPNIEKQRFVTSKEEKEKHGYGLKNVERVVKKYHGTLSFDVTETEFKVSVLL